MSADSTPSRFALLAGFAAIYLIWGSTYLGIRIAVETLPPFLMAGVRFLVAGGLLYSWLWLTKKIRPTPRQWTDNAIIGGLLLLGGNGLVCWAEQKIPSGITTLLISVGPLFIVLADWLVLIIGQDATRGARPTRATFLGLALGFAGLGLLVGPDVAPGAASSLDPLRVAGLMLACASWAAGSVYTRYARNPAEPFTASALQMLAGGGWLLLVSLLLGEPLHFDLAAVTLRSLAAWAYLVVAGSLVAFTAFVWLMKYSTPARVATYAYVNPIVAVFLGWLILHETVSPRLFAAAVIIAGVAVINIAKSQKTHVLQQRSLGEDDFTALLQANGHSLTK